MTNQTKPRIPSSPTDPRAGKTADEQRIIGRTAVGEGEITTAFSEEEKRELLEKARQQREEARRRISGRG